MSEHVDTKRVNEAEVRRSLAGCLQVPAFRRSPKLTAFLSYIVEEELAGRGDVIKAYTIATQALGRADSFDPANDPSVRVEAGRLRRALEEAYSGEAAALPVRIQVPVGGYRPSFEPVASNPGPAPRGEPADEPVPAAQASPPAPPLFESRGQAIVALLLAVIALLLFAAVCLQAYAIVHTGHVVADEVTRHVPV
ncbi:hypothetical protein OPKNFCMD_3428 [Methylobacterium crusticola]|uniref:Tetratricopeptide repeat protein n=1 Tax=Methylobacterium crusticola TaxID=1697972 RepID=A0ABQ4QZD8_9HYPH|nr:hypothetical protein [Methylobacterium crusticola]GJD50683.1 hypothetical protein OPKNFCMD_3428 [Methylobacterium crusticola]